ncbi:MAG: L-fucose/L-arabinose isomerase family protein [Anaerolineaceae bacterium]|nr:L-fucose/L-arabinose isomerase family protein [Anaerolineaceae bacterium]
MPDLPPVIGFVPIARPTFDVPLAQEMTQQVVQQLTGAGFSLVGTPYLVMDGEAVAERIRQLQNTPPDLLLVLQASFADSSMVQALAAQVDAPLLLWALPEARVGGRLRLNSFCGINLAGHALRRAGFNYEYVYAAPDNPAALEKVRILAKAAAVRRRLRDTRIGRVGENPAGFETCIPNQPALKAQLGLEVVPVDLQGIFAGVRAQPAEQVAALAQTVKQQVTGIDEMEAVATNGTLGTFLTLEHIAAAERLDGLAVRCWPEFFTDLGCSACGALSMLSNQLLPCSCESDVNGTITQLILQWISGEPAFGSDLVSFDAAEDVAILWHCGLAPLSMADPSVQPRATIHSNRKMPLLLEFPLKPGRVTLARLSEATGAFRLVIAGGEMLQAPPSFTGTTGTLRFDSGAAAVMDMMLREGLEHHLSLTYGDHRETLLALAQMLNLPVLEL